MGVSDFSTGMAGSDDRGQYLRPVRRAQAVALAGVLLASCGPEVAESIGSATASTTTNASTDGWMGGSGSTTVVDTSAPTTGPDGPYVYKEEVVELEAPPPRGVFSLEALPGGRALVIGGLALDGPDAGKDPDVVTGTLLWRREDGFVAGPELLQPRFEHDSAALSDGSVLVFSGRSTREPEPKILDVERIDFAGLGSEVIGALTEERRDIIAIAEPGDTVVVLGDSFMVAERFDPSTGMSTPLPVELEFPFVSAFLAPVFSAAWRGNGELVVLGGINGSSDAAWHVQGPQVIDMDDNSSRPIGADAGAGTDFRRQALTLPDGSVLLLGNPGHSGLPGPWLMRLDAATDTLTALQELADPKMAFNHTPVGVVLADGRVWIVGEPGSDPGVATHFYDPTSDALTPGPSLPTPTFPVAAVLLDTGPVLLLGGSENPYVDPSLAAFLLE
ncbi:hypothetical protein [Nannocystis sp. SCPEA4]|uniref:hypothetical protein n=1 Tax=Nannocystis sp. SCPEA4 TaxID=2996787 RepID=UPI00226DA79F|nr:hypothetical protein [Nannocystis sp. SCPEA4]MCY1061812.1 hypothetical protein [Nannocystis sp. SCPEA4]